MDNNVLQVVINFSSQQYVHRCNLFYLYLIQSGFIYFHVRPSMHYKLYMFARTYPESQRNNKLQMQSKVRVVLEKIPKKMEKLGVLEEIIDIQMLQVISIIQKFTYFFMYVNFFPTY
eukprot:TRINITY_DN16484_c0_g1_i4.p6 TRINITY_DN16484_c0_g1~~TRINITY_DN16484_c0_g1_i4.p6  ORF type:complete len:117 (-),score=2.13 TRINITY_DN16484_c0_g1_i4:510-860(-)